MDPNWCEYGDFHKWWYPKMDGFSDFIMKIPIQIDGLGVPVPAF